MKTYIYKSRKKEEMYLYLAEKEAFEVLPETLTTALGNDPIFVMELDLSGKRQLAREDVNKVMDNLRGQGFHLQMPPHPSVILQRESADLKS